MARYARPEIQTDPDFCPGRRRFDDVDRVRRCWRASLEPRRAAPEGDLHPRIARRRTMADCAAIALGNAASGGARNRGRDRGGVVRVGASDKAVGRAAHRASSLAAGRNQRTSASLQHCPVPASCHPVRLGTHAARGANRSPGCITQRTREQWAQKFSAALLCTHRLGSGIRFPAAGRIWPHDPQPYTVAAGRPRLPSRSCTHIARPRWDAYAAATNW